MGFRVPRKVYKLSFRDDELEGLEIRCRSGSMGEYMRIEDMVDADTRTADEARELFDLFVGVIIEWNLEDDQGHTLPVTLDSLMQLPPGVVWDAIFAWMNAVSQVSAPLESQSNDGQQSLEASLPMEPLRPSQAS